MPEIPGREHAITSPVVARELGIGMVYQHFTVVPGMTVAENLSFGLRMTGNPKADTERRVTEAARILQLDHSGPDWANAVARTPAE